jgi:hypothetical protein
VKTCLDKYRKVGFSPFIVVAAGAFVGTNPQLTLTSEYPVIRPQFRLTLDCTPGFRIALNVPEAAAVRSMKSDASKPSPYCRNRSGLQTNCGK